MPFSAGITNENWKSDDATVTSLGNCPSLRNSVTHDVGCHAGNRRFAPPTIPGMSMRSGIAGTFTSPGHHQLSGNGHSCRHCLRKSQLCDCLATSVSFSIKPLVWRSLSRQECLLLKPSKRTISRPLLVTITLTSVSETISRINES
jgi:hypothetical protein